MTDQKEYTTIVSTDDNNDNQKKRGGVSFKILSGVVAAVTLSSGGYHLFHSNNNNSPQGLSMTTNVLRSSGGCMKDQTCGLGSHCVDNIFVTCPPDKMGCGQIDRHGCNHNIFEIWYEEGGKCILA